MIYAQIISFVVMVFLHWGIPMVGMDDQAKLMATVSSPDKEVLGCISQLTIKKVFAGEESIIGDIANPTGHCKIIKHNFKSWKYVEELKRVLLAASFELQYGLRLKDNDLINIKYKRFKFKNDISNFKEECSVILRWKTGCFITDDFLHSSALDSTNSTLTIKNKNSSNDVKYEFSNNSNSALTQTFNLSDEKSNILRESLLSKDHEKNQFYVLTQLKEEKYICKVVSVWFDNGNAQRGFSLHRVVTYPQLPCDSGYENCTLDLKNSCIKIDERNTYKLPKLVNAQLKAEILTYYRDSQQFIICLSKDSKKENSIEDNIINMLITNGFSYHGKHYVLANKQWID